MKKANITGAEYLTKLVKEKMNQIESLKDEIHTLINAIQILQKGPKQNNQLPDLQKEEKPKIKRSKTGKHKAVADHNNDWRQWPSHIKYKGKYIKEHDDILKALMKVGGEARPCELEDILKSRGGHIGTHLKKMWMNKMVDRKEIGRKHVVYSLK